MRILDKLMSKIIVDEKTGCWNWTAAKIHGYGTFEYLGIPRRAHRMSYELHHGPIPPGIFVCHRCDNTSCINPEHLFLGTHTENMADMVAKGRQARMHGSSNGLSKLSESDVLSIRKVKGLTNQRIADQFGVSAGLISMVRNRKIWTHI